jgi:hypothetical protein
MNSAMSRVPSRWYATFAKSNRYKVFAIGAAAKGNFATILEPGSCATAHEIMAITGHRSLEEVERYTRAARQGRLADAAMMKFKPRTDSVPPK